MQLKALSRNYSLSTEAAVEDSIPPAPRTHKTLVSSCPHRCKHVVPGLADDALSTCNSIQLTDLHSMNSNHSTSCCHLCEMPQALATNSKSCTQMPYQQKYLSRALCGAPCSDKDILTEPKSADTYIIESHTILVPPSTT